MDPSDRELETFEPERRIELGEREPSAPAPPRQERSALPWVAGALALAVGAGLVWYALFGRSAPQPPQTAEVAAPAPLATSHAPAGVCIPAGDIALPPLDESDTFAGTMATSLSMHPRVVAWLATDDIIRRFVNVVDSIATGKSPAAYLGALRPAGAFRTRERGNALLIDGRSFDRYAPVAQAVASVDVAAAARVCSALKPRLTDAYGELGRPAAAFDGALEQAIVALLRTPAIDAETPLVPDGARFGFEDPALEALTPAQKHLARMGPIHMRVVQDKLREIALAIGIPAERLPN
jgi:hypothetical protein